ncbi:MAG: FGGY-family carbohydrate kinase [Oscillospiraceae bacterium]|nr:FGGY-family carbohydrate kinase [Oscillospiraceae bacterium]
MVLGIELGSTRIKGVVIDSSRKVVQSGFHNWENRLENGFWTYSLDDVRAGLRDVISQLDLNTASITALGVSAMMHGYLAFDKNNNLLTPFRTWRNTTTEQAAAKLTELFGFNIPQRWSVAHLEQAILNGEAHVKDIAFITTLAGYVHFQLTGAKVLGVGDASGMFPLKNGSYNEKFIKQFQELTGINWTSIAPKIKSAGEPAGALTASGAELLGLSEKFIGVPLCPPEGDAGTGMVATNAIAPRTGNISAGTSIFAMAVLEKPLENLHTEIDIVTTPTGADVAMIHCNSCTSDIDAWIKLFGEVSGLTASQLYDLFYEKAAQSGGNTGGVLTYNFYSGEPVAGLTDGRPMLIRAPDAEFNLASLCKSLLYSAIATLRIGMDILFAENVRLDVLRGHGGFFKNKTGIQAAANSLGVPVSVLESAGEGGAWGIALLADYMLYCELTGGQSRPPLQEYLKLIFTEPEAVCEPSEAGVNDFNAYLEAYKKGLEVQRTAAEML